jgi:hypothetical protein
MEREISADEQARAAQDPDWLRRVEELWREAEGKIAGGEWQPWPPPPECCGAPMEIWVADVFGVRVFRCTHRPHHPVFFRQLATGRQVGEEDLAGDGRSVTG